jgi:hypothetical protein
MNSKRILIFLAIILFIASCEMVVDVDLPDIPEKLIINCLFETGKPFEVYINHCVDILYNNDSTSFVDNAIVSMYGDDVLLGTIPNQGNGVYLNETLIPTPGVKYRIVVSAPGYDEVWAEDTAPEPTAIDSINFDTSTYYDSEGIEYHRTGILFSDDPNSKNYYEIIFQCFNTKYDYFFSYGPRNDNDRVITNEGDELFYSKICVFSDELINGQLYWLRTIDTRKIWEEKYKINLLTTSETMYRFRKSWIRHDYAKSPDILNPIEPVTLYSNINGGYGIFAGFSNSTFYINFDDEK